MTECDGVLLRGDRIVPPTSLRAAILRQAHEGHPGAEVMKRRLRSKVWWPKMDNEVDVFVKKCFSCTLVSRPEPPPPLSRTSLPAQAWDFVAIDYMGPLPSGDHVLVVVDYFSRFVEIGFTKSPSSSETIRLLWRCFARHGFPARLKTDNAQAFKSVEFTTFLEEYGVEHVTSPPLWPQANGEVERQNQSLLKRLKIAAAEGKHLEIEACKFLLLQNSTPHSTTGVPPAQLIFNRKLRDKLPCISQPSVQREDIADRDADKKFDGKVYADARAKARTPQIQRGDSVLLRARPTNKLSPSFDPSPFQVVAADGKEVTIQRDGKQLRRSVADVKRCPVSEPAILPPASPTRHSRLLEPVGTPRRSSGSLSPPRTPSSNVLDCRHDASPTLSPRPSAASSVPDIHSPSDFPPLRTSRYGRVIKPPQRFDP